MAMLAPNGFIGVERILKWQHHAQSLTWNSCFEWLACSACFTLVSICYVRLVVHCCLRAPSNPTTHTTQAANQLVPHTTRPLCSLAGLKGQHHAHVSCSTLSGHLAVRSIVHRGLHIPCDPATHTTQAANLPSCTI